QGAGRRRGLRGARLGVVDDRVAGALVPDLDAELVHAARARLLAVQRRHQEAIAAGAVERARTLILRLGTGNHQPIVTGGVEVEVGGWELELGVALRHRGAWLVLGVEAEVRPAGEARVRRVSAGRRCEPAAAGDKAGAGVVD